MGLDFFFTFVNLLHATSKKVLSQKKNLKNWSTNPLFFTFPQQLTKRQVEQEEN